MRRFKFRRRPKKFRTGFEVVKFRNQVYHSKEHKKWNKNCKTSIPVTQVLKNYGKVKLLMTSFRYDVTKLKKRIYVPFIVEISSSIPLFSLKFDSLNVCNAIINCINKESTETLINIL